MTKPIHFLENIDIDEISILDCEPAVKRARIAITKAEEPTMTDATEKLDRDAAIQKMQDADARIESLAKRHAQEHGGDVAKGYQAALQTPEGRRLYAEYSQARYAL